MAVDARYNNQWEQTTLSFDEVVDLYPHTNEILAERGSQYGDFRENFQLIADLWSAYTGSAITPHDVAWMMNLLKCARSKGNTKWADNYLDAKGYVDLAELLG